MANNPLSAVGSDFYRSVLQSYSLLLRGNASGSAGQVGLGAQNAAGLRVLEGGPTATLTPAFVAASLTTAGGLNVSAAATLFSKDGGGAGGGIAAALGLDATLAMRAYSNGMNGLPQGSAQAAAMAASASFDPGRPEDVQRAVQNAQAAQARSTLDLLG